MSKRGIGSSLQVRSLEDLIGGNISNTGTEYEEGVVELALDKLVPFANHTFKVLDDEQMEELVDSIRKYGIVTPITVREKPDGIYEIISGHRRSRGALLAGLSAVPAIVRELNDDEATIEMVYANIQRENILPSEKAKSYAQIYSKNKKQGQRNAGQAFDTIQEKFGDSPTNIRRYVRLAQLSDELLKMVDDGHLGFTQGVDISYLTLEAQEWVLEYLQQKGSKPISIKQSAKLRECAQRGELTSVMVTWSLCGIKGKEATEVSKTNKTKLKPFQIKRDTIINYFDHDTSDEYMEEIIVMLLDKWRKGETV